MRICLIAPNRFHHDRRFLAAHRVLSDAGHDVAVIAIDNGTAEQPVTHTVPQLAFEIGGRLGKTLHRLLPATVRDRLLHRRMVEAAVKTGVDIFMPLHPRVLTVGVEAARRTGAVVHRTPEMDPAGDVDLVVRAPADPNLAEPPLGQGVFHTPADPRQPYTPEPGRYAGRKVVLCYRKTDSNPGKYLEAALQRSGIQLRLETTGIDLSTVDPETDAVIFVEGPYPALDVSGTTRVPTLFWAHHGEHHLYTNVRLADRYRADAMLLAHSWHLAHWYPAPVHRYPFGVATELLDPSKPLAERRFDVAMVGAKLREGGPYNRRQQIVAELEAAFPQERLALAEKVTARTMAEMYADARIVVNEGGARHWPITMRVLEAVGSGAVLLSDPLPGTEMILAPGTEFAILSDDVVADVRRLLSDIDSMQKMADRALKRASGLHTYDHRVDELMAIAGEVEKRPIPHPRTTTDLARLIDRDAEVQRLVHYGAPELVGQLPNREVWEMSEIRPERLQPGNIEAVVVKAASTEGLEVLLDSARRYIYAQGQVSGLAEYLEASRPQAVARQEGDITRVDLMAEAYRVMPHEVIQG